LAGLAAVALIWMVLVVLRLYTVTHLPLNILLAGMTRVAAAVGAHEMMQSPSSTA